MAFLDLRALKEIVVTGGAGFAGSHVVDMLLARCPDAHIRVLDALARSADLSNLRRAFESGRVSLFHGDTGNPEAVNRVTEGADLIVDIAAETSADRAFANPAHVHAAMVTGTQVLIDAMRRNAVPLMLHVGSAAVYGRSAAQACREDAPLLPKSPLAAAKAAAEMVIRSQQEAYGLDIRILRPVAIAGERQQGGRILPSFISQALSGRPLTIHGSGQQRRCFVTVSDFCDALATVLSAGAPSGVYNVGTAEEYSAIELADIVLAAVPSSDAGYIAIRDRPAQDMRRVVDTTALEALGWSPRSSLAAVLPDLISDSAHRLDMRHRQTLSSVPTLDPGGGRTGEMPAGAREKQTLTRH